MLGRQRPPPGNSEMVPDRGGHVARHKLVDHWPRRNSHEHHLGKDHHHDPGHHPVPMRLRRRRSCQKWWRRRNAPMALSRRCSASTSAVSTPMPPPPGVAPIGSISARRACDPAGATSTYRYSPFGPKRVSARSSHRMPISATARPPHDGPSRVPGNHCFRHTRLRARTCGTVDAVSWCIRADLLHLAQPRCDQRRGRQTTIRAIAIRKMTALARRGSSRAPRSPTTQTASMAATAAGRSGLPCQPCPTSGLI